MQPTKCEAKPNDEDCGHSASFVMFAIVKKKKVAKVYCTCCIDLSFTIALALNLSPQIADIYTWRQDN